MSICLPNRQRDSSGYIVRTVLYVQVISIRSKWRIITEVVKTRKIEIKRISQTKEIKYETLKMAKIGADHMFYICDSWRYFRGI